MSFLLTVVLFYSDVKTFLFSLSFARTLFLCVKISNMA
jgi:hypothetical protein